MNITKVGISVAVCNIVDGKAVVLMGRRKGSHGAGEWSFPGGHLDYMEGFLETAERELAEEVGSDFKVANWRTVSVINMTEYAPKHYVDIGMACLYVDGEAKVMEPDKCEEWLWVPVNDLPSPRFATIDKIVHAAKLGPLDAALAWDKGETL